MPNDTSTELKGLLLELKSAPPLKALTISARVSQLAGTLAARRLKASASEQRDDEADAHGKESRRSLRERLSEADQEQVVRLKDILEGHVLPPKLDE